MIKKHWLYGSPFSMRFFADGDDDGGGGGGDSPVTSVDLGGIKDHKGEDGLNFFTDEHRESLDAWGSDDPTKAKFRTKDNKLDVPKLTKSYLELSQKMGKTTNPLPDNATESERFEYQRNIARMLNVPATPDEYVLIEPKDLPESMAVDNDVKNELKIGSHKHNMSNEAVQFVYDLQNKFAVKQMEIFNQALTKQNDESEIKLRAHLGGADKFAANDELLQRYVHDFTETEEQFDAVFEGIKKTLFSGGEPVRTVIMKALCHAAEQFKGEAKSIYSDAQKKMSDLDEIKKQFPNSWKEMI